MGRPKHSLRLRDGRTMIEHVVDVLRGICDEVVVLGPADVLPAVRHVEDRQADCGPLAGIEALLASAIAPQYLVCACDTPLLTSPLLRRLLVATDTPITMFRIENVERCEPVPMRIAASALPEAQLRLTGTDRSIHGFACALPREELVIATREAEQLRNINTPEDYESACSLM